MSALRGIRILDLSRVLAGPFCTQLLADYGADVIKVERPPKGDDTRAWGPPFVTGKDAKDTSESAYYLAINRNKRSIAVDIKDPEGAQLIQDMAKKSDVFVENFKVGGLAKYALDYETIRKINPNIIYCSISGYGQTGPNARKPGYDIISQAFSGLMSITGSPEGKPMKVGTPIADVVCGLYASTAILAALYHRDRGGKGSGEGQHIDISLTDCQIPCLINNAHNYLLSGEVPKRLGNEHPNIVPYQVFATLDGHVVLAVGNDTQFRKLCEIIDAQSIGENPKFKTNSLRVVHRLELIEQLSAILKRFSSKNFVDLLDAHAIPAGVVQNIAEMFASDQVAARNMKIRMDYPRAKGGSVHLVGNPVVFEKTPVTYRYAPPTCGEHTESILEELLANSEN